MAPIEQVIRSLTGADQTTRQERERLNLLKDAAEARLRIAEHEISTMLQADGSGGDRLYIVPGTLTEFQRRYAVQTQETPDEGVSVAVDSFFRGSYKESLKAMARSAVADFFYDTTAGGQTKKYCFLMLEHDAFIRVDVIFWKYYFEQKGLTDSIRQAFCYSLAKSVVDHRKVSANLMVHLVSQYARNENKDIEALLDAIPALWNKLMRWDATR